MYSLIDKHPFYIVLPLSFIMVVVVYRCSTNKKYNLKKQK